MKFSPESVAAFIAVLGVLSIIAQVSVPSASDVREGALAGIGAFSDTQ